MRLSGRGLHLAVVRLLVVTAILLMRGALAVAQAPSTASTDRSDTGGWKTVIYPIHAWLPVFGAEVRLPAQPGPPESGDIIPEAKTSGTFNGAALAGFRVERWRISVDGEFLWAGMSGSVEAPRFLIDLDTIAFKMKGGFRIAPALYVDAGVHRLAVKMDASVLDFPQVTWEPGYWEPVVGMTFRPQLSRNVRIMSKADLGGLVDDAHRTVAANVAIEWMPVRHVTIGGGYGVLFLRSDGTIRDEPVHVSQTLHGPVFTFGVVF